MEVVLYDYYLSSAAYRVRIALNLAGIAYRAVPVNLALAEQRSEDHLARNPQGFVPVVEIDGLRLTQSLAIVEYLDETRGLGLLPVEPAARAQGEGAGL
jgi:maleylacetoacetate isomerase